MEERYVASVSWGKDSLAMLWLLLGKNYPLHEVVFYDTGMEFQAIYDTRDKMVPLLEHFGITYTELKPKRPFLYDMFEKPKKGGGKGYGWCGGPCRWGTTFKTEAIDAYAKQCKRYIGIAADETKRLNRAIAQDSFKLYPLADAGMTERDCLNYCYSIGYFWEENGGAGTVRLYDILDHVSCWRCRNKNLKELKNIYRYLPAYWERLKYLQWKLVCPMKGHGKGVFELEERFKAELAQVEIGGEWSAISQEAGEAGR